MKRISSVSLLRFYLFLVECDNEEMCIPRFSFLRLVIVCLNLRMILNQIRRHRYHYQCCQHVHVHAHCDHRLLLMTKKLS